MAEKIELIKEVYGRNTFSRVVNTAFSEFALPTTASLAPGEQLTVEAFFDLYDALFFEIPATGELNSHEYLVARSTEYLGGGVLTENEKAYIEEINALRQQLLEANANILSLNNLV